MESIEAIHERVVRRLLERAKRAKKIKSNDPMPARSKANVDAMMDVIRGWDDDKNRKKALEFADEVGHTELFELLHGMRRWYTGQTMARMLRDKYGEVLAQVMDLEPDDAVGCFRGFKVDKDSDMAQHEVGDEFIVKVKLNHGFSSWSTTEAPTHRFSGAGKGKVGLIIKLVSPDGVVPVLAPPDRTRSWFNELYERVIGTSFRPKEGEYLIAGKKLQVRVIRVKK